MILAIDPGSEQSACIILGDEKIHYAKILQNTVVSSLFSDADILVIEKIESYGMSVGASVFQTCFWTGRFVERWEDNYHQKHEAILIPRREVKLYFCGTARAKDGNIRQALIDRFGPPGTKKKPSWTYGISKDLWQALALGIFYQDKQKSGLERIP